MRQLLARTRTLQRTVQQYDQECAGRVQHEAHGPFRCAYRGYLCATEHDEQQPSPAPLRPATRQQQCAERLCTAEQRQVRVFRAVSSDWALAMTSRAQNRYR